MFYKIKNLELQMNLKNVFYIFYCLYIRRYHETNSFDFIFVKCANPAIPSHQSIRQDDLQSTDKDSRKKQEEINNELLNELLESLQVTMDDETTDTIFFEKPSAYIISQEPVSMANDGTRSRTHSTTSNISNDMDNNHSVSNYSSSENLYNEEFCKYCNNFLSRERGGITGAFSGCFKELFSSISECCKSCDGETLNEHENAENSLNDDNDCQEKICGYFCNNLL